MILCRYRRKAVSHPELATEQAYLDHAYECLDRMRSTLERTGDAMATEFAAIAMEAWAKRRVRTFQDAERGLCFGRLTLDEALRPLYIGRRWVHDDEREVLVVNWQAPAARPFYTATPSDPQRVTQRRRYRTDGRRIVDISDESLDGTAVEGAAVSDFLLEELERRREGRMRDIVATIQSDQYRLITAAPEGALVVQGGPGTGKTAVGLHRASWLLYTHRGQLRRVLVVGPNPTFMDYVSHVLPALGEDAVEQRAVSELLDGIEVGREDAQDVARLKADPRLGAVVTRAVELAVRPEPEELVLYVDGHFVSVREREVRELLADALDSGMALSAARGRFRMAVLRRFYERYGELLEDLAFRSFDEIERALQRKGFLTRYLERVLALPRPDKLVAKLLTSPAALAEAAEGILSAEEQKLVLRDRPRRTSELRWSAHDLPLLDVARTLVEGPPRGFGHVIVDEAQDLSPMQLEMVSRRAVDGSLTILGDVAQATGPVACAMSPRIVTEPARARRATIRSCIGVRSCASSTITCPNARGGSASSARASSTSGTSWSLHAKPDRGRRSRRCAGPSRIPSAASARRAGAVRRERTRASGAATGQTRSSQRGRKPFAFSERSTSAKSRQARPPSLVP